jgi:hypothetical protein
LASAPELAEVRAKPSEFLDVNHSPGLVDGFSDEESFAFAEEAALGILSLSSSLELAPPSWSMLTLLVILRG